MSGRILGVAGVVVGLYLIWIALGYGELTSGITGFCERVSGSATLVLRDSNAQINEDKTERYGYIEPYLEVAGTICLGVLSAFWAFQRLQSAVHGRGRSVCLLVLMVSFALCAYGFGLLLELAAEGG
jgi:hypothetical protein